MIIAVESATTAVAVALVRDGETIAEVTIGHGRRHAESLMPAVTFLCAQTMTKLSDATSIAVDVGPGLFTGLRVGVATALGLSLSLGVPAIGIGSLDALAAAVPAALAAEPLVALIDARRGEVYASAYVGGTCVVAPFVGQPGAVAGRIAAAVGRGVHCVGDGDVRHATALAEHLDLRPVGAAYRAPTAGAVGRLAWDRLAAGTPGAGEELIIVYLRAPDAEINWTTRSAQTTTDTGS